MYSITKAELIFILDTTEEFISVAEAEGFPDEELREVVTIVNGILDNVQVEVA